MFQSNESAGAKAVAITSALVLAGSLLCSIDSSLGYPNAFRSSADPTWTDRPVAASIPVLSAPIKFSAQATPSNFEMTAGTPVMYLSFTYDQTAIMRRASLELPDKFSLRPVERRTEAQKDIASERSKRPIALYNLRRKLETSGQRISFDRPSLAPMAFVRFCIKYPRDCEIRHMAFRPRPVVLSPTQKAELAKVNHAVNRAITSQVNGNGVMQEEWLISPREGDCNDYAVTKRHELLVRGWPSRSLLLTEVVIPSGEHHLVLLVRTRDGDLVLDNLNPNIRLVSQVHYQWVRAQQEQNPKFWSTIDLAHAPRVAMNAD